MGRGLGIAVLLVMMGVMGSPGICIADAAADQAYQEALQLYGAGNYSAALPKAEAAAQADPKHWQAWQLAGNCRVALNDNAGAITEYGYSLSINPDNPQLKAYVDQLKAAGQPVPAATAPADHYQAATAAYNAGDYDKVLTEGAEAVKDNPQNWEAWQLVGNARYARGDKAGAQEAYRKSLEINPANTQLKVFSDGLAAELRGNSAPVSSPAITPAATSPSPEKTKKEKPKFRYSIGLEGGVAMVSLSPFEDKIKEYITGDVKPTGLTPKISDSVPGNAVLVGIDGVACGRWFGVGFALDLALMDDLKVNGLTEDSYGNSFEEDWTINAGWLEGTVGVFGQLELLGWIYGRAGVHAGLGLASVRVERSIRIKQPPFIDLSANSDENTSGLMIPFGAEAEGGVRLAEKVEIFIKVGWESRYAPILTADEGYDKNGDGKVDSSEEADKMLIDVDQNAWPIDQSGLYVKVGARITRF